jgi:hypothetical protein
MVDVARLADELRAEQVGGSTAWLMRAALVDKLRAEQVVVALHGRRGPPG